MSVGRKENDPAKLARLYEERVLESLQSEQAYRADMEALLSALFLMRDNVQISEQAILDHFINVYQGILDHPFLAVPDDANPADALWQGFRNIDGAVQAHIAAVGAHELQNIWLQEIFNQLPDKIKADTMTLLNVNKPDGSADNPLSFFTIKPIQRITKWPLLLRDINHAANDYRQTDATFNMQAIQALQQRVDAAAEIVNNSVSSVSYADIMHDARLTLLKDGSEILLTDHLQSLTTALKKIESSATVQILSPVNFRALLQAKQQTGETLTRAEKILIALPDRHPSITALINIANAEERYLFANNRLFLLEEMIGIYQLKNETALLSHLYAHANALVTLEATALNRAVEAYHAGKNNLSKDDKALYQAAKKRANVSGFQDDYSEDLKLRYDDLQSALTAACLQIEMQAINSVEVKFSGMNSLLEEVRGAVINLDKNLQLDSRINRYLQDWSMPNTNYKDATQRLVQKWAPYSTHNAEPSIFAKTLRQSAAFQASVNAIEGLIKKIAANLAETALLETIEKDLDIHRIGRQQLLKASEALIPFFHGDELKALKREVAKFKMGSEREFFAIKELIRRKKVYLQADLKLSQTQLGKADVAATRERRRILKGQVAENFATQVNLILENTRVELNENLMKLRELQAHGLESSALNAAYPALTAAIAKINKLDHLAPGPKLQALHTMIYDEQLNKNKLSKDIIRGFEPLYDGAKQALDKHARLQEKSFKSLNKTIKLNIDSDDPRANIQYSLNDMLRKISMLIENLNERAKVLVDESIQLQNASALAKLTALKNELMPLATADKLNLTTFNQALEKHAAIIKAAKSNDKLGLLVKEAVVSTLNDMQKYSQSANKQMTKLNRQSLMDQLTEINKYLKSALGNKRQGIFEPRHKNDLVALQKTISQLMDNVAKEKQLPAMLQLVHGALQQCQQNTAAKYIKDHLQHVSQTAEALGRESGIGLVSTSRMDLRN